MPDPRLYQLPKTIGGSSTGIFSMPVLILCIVLTNAIATQFMASHLGYSPELGAPWMPAFHPFGLTLPMTRHLYNPFMWAWWVCKFNWPVYGPEVRDTCSSVFRIIIGGALASVVAMVATDIAFGRRKNDPKHLTDSAHWATAEEVRNAGLFQTKCGPIVSLFPIEGSGFFGFFKKFRAMRYDGENGVNTVARPGGGKTSGFVKTNLLIELGHVDRHRWKKSQRKAHPWGEEPSIVVLDIKGTASNSSWAYQKSIGKDVLLLEPFGNRPGLAQYNPLDKIRVGTDDEYGDSMDCALDIVDGEGNGLPTHWDKTSLAFGAALILKLAYRALNTGNPDWNTLPGLLDFVSSRADINGLIMDLLNVPDDPEDIRGWNDFRDGRWVPSVVHPSIASAAREMATKTPTEMSGVHSTLLSFLSLYRDAKLRRNIMRSTVNPHLVANGPRPVTLYIKLSPKQLDRGRPLIRTIMNDFFRSTLDEVDDDDGREVRKNLRPVIIVGDEIAALKRMANLEVGAGYFRGFGMMLWLFWQSVAQMVKYYTENESLTETMDVHIAFRPNTPKASKQLMEWFGKFNDVVLRRNRSGKRYEAALGNVNESIETPSRDLVTPTELRRMKKNDVIVMYQGLTIYSRVASYFLFPELRQRARMKCPRISDVLIKPKVSTPATRATQIVNDAIATVAAAAAQAAAAGGSGDGPVPGYLPTPAALATAAPASTSSATAVATLPAAPPAAGGRGEALSVSATELAKLRAELERTPVDDISPITEFSEEIARMHAGLSPDIPGDRNERQYDNDGYEL